MRSREGEGSVWKDTGAGHPLEDEIGFARAVAAQASMAIENARLISETLEMKSLLEARKIIERAKGILQHKDELTESGELLDSNFSATLLRLQTEWDRPHPFNCREVKGEVKRSKVIK